jgi:hypothetical protein
MTSSSAERDFSGVDFSALVEAALDDAKRHEGDDLERILGITRIYEEIALRAEIDDSVLTRALSSPDQRARFFHLIAYGATAVGGLLLQSIDAEEKGDALAREKVDEVGSRLQHVTVELARIGARGN